MQIENHIITSTLQYPVKSLTVQLANADKIFSKKTIIFIFNKVYKDLKVNKASWTSPMTKKAWDANKFNF